MRRLIKPTVYLLAATSVLVLLAAVWYFQLFTRLGLHWAAWQHAEARQQDSLWLPGYRAVQQARPIDGVADVSALTWDAERRILLAVTNKPAAVLELSRYGALLRQIPLTGISDPEAIEYLSPGRFIISDERSQTLVKVRIDASTQALDVRDAPRLALGIGLNGNKGFEGLAYDPERQKLFVAKERDPMRVYAVQGFPPPDSGVAQLSIREMTELNQALVVRDLSSLHFDSRTQHLLAVSDESRLVLEIDLDGTLLGSLSLLPGQHGLKRGVPQAEGMTMDEQGVLYLVSEPNLFYRFVPQGAED